MPRTRLWKPIPRDTVEHRDGVIERVTAGAQSLYFRLHTQCDDGGAFRSNASWVRSTCYPMADHITTEQVHAWLGELSDPAVRLVEWYSVAGEAYGRIVGYEPAQVSKARYKYPRPDGAEPAPPIQDAAGPAQMTFHVEQPAPPALVPVRSDTFPFVPIRSGSFLKVPPVEPVGSLNENENEKETETETISTSTAAAVAPPDGEEAASSRVVATIVSDLSRGNPDAGRRLWADTILDILKPDLEHTTGDYQDLSILALTIARKSGKRWIDQMVDALLAARITAESGGRFGAWRNQMVKMYGEWRKQ